MINGKGGKGALLLIGYILSVVACLVIVGFITAPIIWIVGMVMAYRDAQKWNRDHGILS
jgi:uncharacterized membrane protein